MVKLFGRRISAVVFFFSLLVAGVLCLQRVIQDIEAGKYFNNPDEFFHEIVFLSSYALIIFFIIRYGYYLAIDRVNWKNIKDDFIYLLNRKYFSKTQWIINLLLFWLSLFGFIFSLVISTMKGRL
jgi:hypothetical protein